MKFLRFAAASLMLALGSTPVHAGTYVAQFGGNMWYTGHAFSGKFNFDDSIPVSADGSHHNAISNFSVESDDFKAALGAATVKFPNGKIEVKMDSSYSYQYLNYLLEGSGPDSGFVSLVFPKDTLTSLDIPTDVKNFLPSQSLLSFRVSGAFYGFYGNVTSFSISPVGDSDPAGVPEPASWALLIGGLGLAGGAVRLRHAVAACAVTA